jgi:signal peptidase II
VHVLNPGAAFSFLADAGGWQKHFFSIFALAISAILARLLWTGVRSTLESAAYVCLIGGGLGNVIDRLRIGAVIDYLDLHWQDLHWPAFNLADVFVMSGAFLLLTTSFGTNRTEHQSTQ